MGNDTTTVTEGIVPQGSNVLFENAETFEIQREYDNRKRSYFCNKEQKHI